MSNIVEKIRETSIKDIFKLSSFSTFFPTWRTTILSKITDLNDPIEILNLGDHLKEVFITTSSSGRSQSTLSAGGKAWEALVSWYLNLCLIGSRAVIIKQKKRIIPKPISQAISVNYESFKSNTEADLVVIIFPPEHEFIEKNEFTKENTLDMAIGRKFRQFQVGIIQCKTNWNDNAQIPMLWDMVYSSDGFGMRNITIGDSAYSIKHLNKFFYSFVTVPTGKSKYKTNSTAVMRVRGITGGNFWGQPTSAAIANSLKDIFGRNFGDVFDDPQIEVLREHLPQLSSTYSYFQL